MNEVEHVLSVNCQLGEGPIWNSREQNLYWVDIEKNTIHTWHPESGAHQTTVFTDAVCAMGFRKKGGLVLATRKHFAFWDGVSDAFETFYDVEADQPENRFNDGAVDRQGRFWAGTMHPSAASCSLYRLNPDLTVDTMVGGVQISNGIGWSPDNRTMYYTDSPIHTIYAFDFDAASGAIANRRVHIHTPGQPGVPDGLTVDSEGFIWGARWDGYRITRYTPAGKEDRVIELPIARVTSLTFGGPDLKDLYITSAWSGFSEDERRKSPLAGDLFRVSVDVPGLPEPYFAG